MKTRIMTLIWLLLSACTLAAQENWNPVPDFTTREEDGYLYITTDALELRYRVGSVPSPSAKNTSSLTIRLNVAGRQVSPTEESMSLRRQANTTISPVRWP